MVICNEEAIVIEEEATSVGNEDVVSINKEEEAVKKKTVMMDHGMVQMKRR